MLVFSAFRLDVDEGHLWKGDKALTLRRKPFAILAYLAANPRRLVTHEEIMQHVWGGAAVSDSAVRTHLHELRQVLGEGVIETVIGRGYRFTVQPTTGVEVEVAPAMDDEIVVGRDQELAVLQAALERATAGHRQLCFVTGEPGIGKSTLVDAFARSLEGRADVTVVRGQSVEQRSTPEAFLPVIEVLAQLRRSAIGEMALASLIRFAPTFLAQLPTLIPDSALDEVNRRARPSNDSRSVRELLEALEAISTNHTIVVVLEDLQWSDVATIDLLSALGQRRERARLLVIGTSRRAEAQTVGHPLNHVLRTLVARAGAIAIPVERIADTDIGAFLDRRFPGHAFPAALIAAIDRITGGTPLFVVSFVEDLVGRGMLVERDGHWQLTMSIEEVAAHRPDSVRQLIDIQLDRLTPEEQRLLEAASAVGIEFSTATLAAALDASLESVDELCDSLARRSLFLRRVGVEEWPDGTFGSRYGVTHGLVHELNLERGSPTRRQRWHLQIASRLEAAYGERVSEIAHSLAIHFDSAGALARAVHFYKIAAARSTLRFASRDALALFERAHALVHRMPPSLDRDLIELDLLEGKTQSVIRNTAHAVRAPLEIFEQMLAIARRLGDLDRVATTLANFRVRLVTLAEYDRATELAAQLEAIAETQPLPPAAVALDTMGRVLDVTWRGDLERARDMVERETSDWSPPTMVPGMIGPSDAKAIFMVQLSIVYWLLGRPRDAQRAIGRVIERASNSGDPYILGHAQVSRARLLWLDGASAAEIREVARGGLAIPGAEVWHPQCTLLVGLADSYERALSAAELDEQFEIFRGRSSEFPMGTTYMGLLLATTAARSGDTERARLLLDELLAFARRTGERIVEPELVRARGDLLPDAESRAAAFREAIEIASAQRSRSFQLRAALALAALWRDDRRLSDALQLVREAMAHIADDTHDLAAARRLV